jgi:hypothetical protein
LAADILSIFRVQEITFTPVDVEHLPDEEDVQALAPEIERMFDETLTLAMDRRPEETTEAQARDVAQFAIRLPAAREASRHEWTPPGRAEMTIDVSQLRAIFDELGYDDVDLPQGLDGKTLSAEFAGMLASFYGGCDPSSRDADCITLLQMGAPTVSVPDGLDVEHLGRIYLELLGTPADEAARLSQQIDWTTTLVLPFPHHVNLTHETVSLKDVEATVIHSESPYRPDPEYLVTWVDQGVVYAVAGRDDCARGLDLARSLQ